MKGVDLLPNKVTESRNPYVCAALLPDRKEYKQTQVVFDCLNPKWNQFLSFSGYPLEKLQKMRLHVVAMDFQPLLDHADEMDFTSNYEKFIIGGFVVDLAEIDITVCKSITGELLAFQDLSIKLEISLEYDISIKELKVLIIRAHNLDFLHENYLLESYLKIDYVSSKNRVLRQTQIRTHCRNPIYNAHVNIPVNVEELAESTLKIFIMKPSKTTPGDQPIGSVFFTSNEDTVESQNWDEIITRKKEKNSEKYMLQSHISNYSFLSFLD